MIEAGWKDEMYKFLYHSMANIVQKLDKAGVDKFVIVLDLATMSYWKIAHYESELHDHFKRTRDGKIGRISYIACFVIYCSDANDLKSIP